MKAIIKKWWLIGIIAILCFGTTFVATDDRQATYGATTSIFSVTYGSYTESMEAYKILQTYSEIATSRRVAERAAEIIGDDRITADNIFHYATVNYTEDSAIIKIRGSHTDQGLAVRIANALAESFIIEAKSTFGIDSLKVLDSANQAYIISGSGQMKYSLIAFLAGILIPMIVIAIKVIVSDEVYYVSDAELDGRLEVLGIIPEQR